MTLLYLDEFLLYLQTNNYSKETVYNYERDLKVFENFLNKDLKVNDFQDINKRTIELYKAYLTSRDRRTAEDNKNLGNLSSFSINRHLSSLRNYFRYLIDMDYTSPVTPSNIKLIKTEKKVPKIAEFEDLKKLIESPTHLEKKPIIAKRNRAMLETLFSTGMRISELVSVKKNQIDKQGQIFIMGKGKKERFVYLTPRAVKHLNYYIKARKDDYTHLFIPHEGKNLTAQNRNISTSYLQGKIKAYREILSINIPTSAHSLRHGFATYMAEQGANPAAIQILLGHESLDTTTRYVHPSHRYAQKTHRRYHPLKE